LCAEVAPAFFSSTCIPHTGSFTMFASSIRRKLWIVAVPYRSSGHNTDRLLSVCEPEFPV
jgi:hypothetical protein